MTFARVVGFEGVTKERIEAMQHEIGDGERPEGVPATEIMLLHEPDGETALAILFFETEDDYRTGDATLNAMPGPQTPGGRTSVTKYTVAVRRQA